MVVRMFGFAGKQRMERRWTLIEDRGDGPDIPSLSVPLFVERILSGTELCGARDAGQSLSLQDYLSAFGRLAINTELVEFRLPDPPYKRIMGAGFEPLPETLRVLHSPLRNAAARGEAFVSRGANPFASVLARLMRFPPPGRYDLHVEFSEREGVERWTRDFDGHRFTSELREKDGMLQERFGPLRFRFDLKSVEGGLEMVMRSWSVFGIKLPIRLAPRSPAREWEENGTFHFNVPVSVPLIGKVVHYRGSLRMV